MLSVDVLPEWKRVAGRAEAAQRAAGEGRAADKLAAGGLRASACPKTLTYPALM